VSWTVVLTGRARRDLRRLDHPVAVRIGEALERLAATGQGDVQRLRGTPDEWRLRVGDWRVRFRYDTAADAIERFGIREALYPCGLGGNQCSTR
jgi:mRNA-degrading endonuclease RelE of RelBE toxin-antitoxin system